ncbi:MAG: HEAT repeat domain-containing protein [Planctomycetota bacterium]
MTWTPFRLSVLALGCAMPLGAQAPASTDHDRLAQHYAQVERELRAADTGHLAPAQRDERQRLLERFRAYRLARDFGINADFPGHRMPYFVDAGGRRCAIANLLDHSGCGQLTLDIAARHNHAWAAELEPLPQLQEWLARSGFTFAEIARIQGPGARGSGGLGPVPLGPQLGDAGLPAYDGPADAATPAPRGAVPAPTTPRARSPQPQPPTTPTRRAAPRGMPITPGPVEWSVWWEWNRSQYLRPNRLRDGGGPVTGPGGDNDGSAFRAAARKAIQSTLVERLQDGDHAVRAAAAVALGRLADADAVPHLCRMLEDPNFRVRNDAILALGATGSGQAVHALLRIATDGSLAPDGPEISPFARPLAVLGLGLARQYGYRGDLDAMVENLLEQTKGQKREESGAAAMLYCSLSPSPRLAALARQIAGNSREDETLRSRAIEALAAAGADKADLARALRAVSGDRLELRRSAALALGVMEDARALPPLQTAFELEPELLTRAFLLISIGRRGDTSARDFLLDVLKSGRKSLRHWSALALGLLGREGDDELIRRRVRDARAAERNKSAVGAYLIASGLLRDRDSLPDLLEALTTSKSADVRIQAAQGLALIGGSAARRAIRERIKVDPCVYTQIALAEVLGFLGHPDDQVLLSEMLDEHRQDAHRARIVAAMGSIGTVEAYERVTEIAGADDEDQAVAASALNSLGQMLDATPGWTIADVCHRANYRLFQPWLYAAARLSL